MRFLPPHVVLYIIILISTVSTEVIWKVNEMFVKEFFKKLSFTQEVRGNQHSSEVSHDPNLDISRTQSRKAAIISFLELCMM